eukprot:EG_transcript_41
MSDSGGITLGLCPNVWVDLLVTEPEGSDDRLKRPLEYCLKDPEQVATQLNLDKSRIDASSKMSPRSVVNVPWEQRLESHIPLDARTFVWANPIMNEPGGMMYAAENDLICFLAYGGFVFFDRRGEMVKINGVKVGRDLKLIGPFPLMGRPKHLQVFEKLKAAGRLNAVTLAGIPAKNFAWVLPEEFPDCSGGAFVYECESPDDNYYFKLADKFGEPDEPASDLGIQLEFMDQQPYVASIAENSPLRVCGVKQGDAIVKWAEHVITNRDTLIRVYKQAKYDQAITLVVRHSRSDEQSGVSYYYFRMKERGWAESHARVGESRKSLLTHIKGLDRFSPGENSPGSGSSLSRHPTLNSGTNFLMPHLDADQGVGWEPDSAMRMRTASMDTLSTTRVADIDTSISDEDIKHLHLRIAEMDPALFEIRLPRYRCTIKDKSGLKVVEGYLSAWTTVNISLDEHNWILPSSECFAFAYPPQTRIPLDDVPLEQASFAKNGAWLYFREKEIQNDASVTLTQAMVVLGQDIGDLKASGKGYAVSMSLATDASNNDASARVLANATQVLKAQAELYEIPLGSVWQCGPSPGANMISWTPPFGIGNTVDFRSGGFILYYESEEAAHRATFYRFEGKPATFISKKGCSADEFAAARKETERLLHGLKGFDPNFTVDTPQKESWSLTCEVPYQLRPATALLAALGRRPDKIHEVITGRGHYEYCASELQPPGIPNVEMDPGYPGIKEDIILDADSMTEYFSKFFPDFDQIMASMGWIFDPNENQPQVNLNAWYGRVLEPEKRVALDQLVRQLSISGFKALRQMIFEARIHIQHVNCPMKEVPDNSVLQDLSRFKPEDGEVIRKLMEYPVSSVCSGRRVHHLRDLYGEKQWKIAGHQFKEIEDSTRIYTSYIMPAQFFLAFAKIIADDTCAQFWKDQSHQSPNDFLHQVNMRVPEEYKKSVEDLQTLLNNVSRDFTSYGFASEEDFSTMLNSSICSLATACCVAQRGYCILDDDNQLQDRPPVDLVFLSACAPDFLDPDKRPQARQELQKYFVPPNDKGRWRSHGEYHGRSALMLRIMDIWRRIFAACKDLKVTHPSLLPMGLGIFRPRVAEEDTYYLYFEAQLSVLEDEDYGFHTVFLNPGRNMPELLHVLSKRRWQFPFNLQVHSRDAKSVANALAKHGKRSCILIPADFLAVLQGYVGSWWECGHNERYTGESHIVATSTAVLARKHISNIWNGHGVIHTLRSIRHQQGKSNVTVTVPVCSYVLKVSNSQPVVMTFAQMVFIDFPQWWGKEPDKEPECINQVTGLLRRSQWGAIDIKTISGATIFAQSGRAEEEDSDTPSMSDPSEFREKVFNTLLESICKEGKQLARGLEDLNAIVIRLDFSMLKQWSYKLAYLLSTLLDLRVKSLFQGVIICACVDNELSAMEVRHVMELGADWVFPYESVRGNYPVQQTFERFMQDLSRLQRFSSALTQAVFESRVQTVRKLLTNGADPNRLHPLTGPWAPLHWVASGQLRDIRGEKRMVESLLIAHNARDDLSTPYSRCLVKRGSTPTSMKMPRNRMSPTIIPPKQSSLRLWGLWVTLDAQTGMDHAVWGRQSRLVDMDRTPVARLRWSMMNHYSLHMWQVYLSHFEEPTPAQWADWLPTKETELGGGSFLSYLRYIVVEVVTPTTTVGVVKWMDAVVSKILNHLHLAKHPTGNSSDWEAWIKQSIIVYVHNASVLEGRIENPQLYYRGARPGPEVSEEPVWITKSFPLTQTREIPIKAIDLCVSSCELNDRLERATVHWLVVTEQAELELPIKHYNMAFCMELEKEYVGGLHVVEKANLYGDGKLIQVNLNLMVELTLEEVNGQATIKKVQKVVRMPDHVCVMDNLLETPHLLQEIRSSNCLLFLGAGFSFPARLPGWSMLLVEAAKKAAGFVKQLKPYDLSKDIVIEPQKLENNQVKIMVKRKNSFEPALTEITVMKEKIISMSEEVQQLVEEPKLENLEMAAQLLEDSCGDVLKWLLKGMLEMAKDGQLLNGAYILQYSEQYKQMAARLLMVRHLPVSGILTTNYDQLLCFCDERQRTKNPCSVAKGITPQTKGRKPQYLNMIRNREKGRSAESEESDSDSRPVIQIHGSTSDPQSIVLTREGYRGLLHLNPAYSNFLKTVMARSTLLYMGFSFTDGYFNEIRSELMTLQEKSGAAATHTQPFSYAVIDGKPQPVREFFTHHEGVHLFSWQASKYGYGVMDRYLECLLRCTHLAAALSQCKVLLFNPQTSPLFLCDDQKVEVVDQMQLLNEYLPSGWNGTVKTGRVVKWDSDHDKPVEDYLLVKLKERMSREGKREMVFRTLLRDVATGLPFFIPRRYVQMVGGDGELQEDMEVHVAVEMLRNHKEFPLKYDLGVDLSYIQYLVPFGLKVLDTRCYLIKLDFTGDLRLVPHKLLRLEKSERHDDRNPQSAGTSLRDLKSIARKVAEDAVQQKNLDPASWANNIQELLHLVQADSLAMNTKAMDHTMETIAEMLHKQENHPLYEASHRNAGLKNHFQRFTLRSNITALALLKSELAQTNCIKTFIIINAANFTTPPRAHIDLFRHLYDSDSEYIHWAYPPRVIVHTGDSNNQKKYEAVFSEYCLWTTWVSYHSTVQAVMEEIQKPVSSKSTNLPVVFRGRGFFKTSNYPEFNETLERLKAKGIEASRWPIPPFHTLSLAHVNGRQQETSTLQTACSFFMTY